MLYYFVDQIAVHGHNFCGAMSRVADLLMRNSHKTAIKYNAVWFLLFLGKLSLVGIIGMSQLLVYAI